MKARRTRPWRTISLTTWLAVLLATAKQMPWAPAITAVLMPITSPREETSGPPELPGLSAASVWMTSSISRPVRERSERPRADTTPAVTVDSKPSGLPIATTSWPRRSPLELPSRAAGSETSSTMRSRARSVCGSSPSTRALTVRVSASASRTDGGALHHMAVGQHQPVGRDHHARAGAAALAACRGRAASRPARPQGRPGRRRRPRPANRRRTAVARWGWFR